MTSVMKGLAMVTGYYVLHVQISVLVLQTAGQTLSPVDTACPLSRDGLQLTEEHLNRSTAKFCNIAMRRAVCDLSCKPITSKYICSKANFSKNYLLYTTVFHERQIKTLVCNITESMMGISTMYISYTKTKPTRGGHIVSCQTMMFPKYTNAILAVDCLKNSCKIETQLPGTNATATSTTTRTSSSSTSSTSSSTSTSSSSSTSIQTSTSSVTTSASTTTTTATTSTTNTTRETAASVTSSFGETSTTPSQNKVQASNTVTLALGVVGGVLGGVVITVVVVVLWWICRKKRRPNIQTEDYKRDSHIYLGLTPTKGSSVPGVVPDVIKTPVTTHKKDTSTNEYEVIPDDPPGMRRPKHLNSCPKPDTGMDEQPRPESETERDYIEIIGEETVGFGVYSLGKACPKTVSDSTTIQNQQ